MLFRQYRDIVDRISRLDKPLSMLTRSERNEVLDLSVRQEELEKYIGEQVHKGFRDLRSGLEVVSEWIQLMEEDSIKALGVEGIPEEVLALEETLVQLHSLNTQISALTLAQYPSCKEAVNNKDEIKAKTAVPEPGEEKPVLPVIQSTIEMEDKEGVISRVLKEVSHTVYDAAPTFHTEIFNEPRIAMQKSRPKKRKRL